MRINSKDRTFLGLNRKLLGQCPHRSIFCMIFGTAFEQGCGFCRVFGDSFVIRHLCMRILPSRPSPAPLVRDLFNTSDLFQFWQLHISSFRSWSLSRNTDDQSVIGLECPLSWLLVWSCVGSKWWLRVSVKAVWAVFKQQTIFKGKGSQAKSTWNPLLVQFCLFRSLLLSSQSTRSALFC